MTEYEIDADLFEPIGLLHQIGTSNSVVGMQLYKNNIHSTGVPLTDMMLDRRMDITVAKNNKSIDETFYFENRHKPKNSSALYIIRMKDANRTIIKVGRAGELLKRLAGYKTSLPLDGEIIVVASLIIEDAGLIYALETLLLNHIDLWSTQQGSQIKRLRRTEWIYKAKKDAGIAVCALAFTNILLIVASKLPKLRCGLYLHSRRVWLHVNTIWDKYKFNMGLNQSEVPSLIGKLSAYDLAVQDATDALVSSDDDDFTEKEKKAKIPKALTSCYVDLSIDNVLE